MAPAPAPVYRLVFKYPGDRMRYPKVFDSPRALVRWLADNHTNPFQIMAIWEADR